MGVLNRPAHLDLVGQPSHDDSCNNGEHVRRRRKELGLDVWKPQALPENDRSKEGQRVDAACRNEVLDGVQKQLPVEQCSARLLEIEVDDIFACFVDAHTVQCDLLLSLIQETDTFREFDEEEGGDETGNDGG